jgi:putative ABC transport system permease protein
MDARRFRPFRRAARQVDDEIGCHLEMRVRELIEQGVPPAEARAAARAAFGDVAAIAAACTVEESRKRRRLRWRGLRLDLAFALRTLAKNPGFTATALLTLALGLGAATAVLTLVDGVLLRPLPYPDSGRLAMVWMVGPETRGPDSELPFSAPAYEDVVAQTRSFAAVAAFREQSYSLVGGSVPEPLAGVRTRPELFALLGVTPQLGRTFTAAEAVRGGPAVVVLGDAVWRRSFGRDPAIVGKSILLGGRPTTVLGVMPSGFAFPRGRELPAGLEFPERTELWTPLVFTDTDSAARGTLNLAVVARLAHGVGLARANADLHTLALRLAVQYPRVHRQLDLHALSLREQAAAPVARGLMTLLGAVAVVLVIACLNVANLLLARTSGRSRELAVRAALGAGQARLARQLITENLLLASAGAALALPIAALGFRGLLALAPATLPRADDVALDGRIFVVVGLVTVLIGVAFGLVTARAAIVANAAAALNGAARSTGSVQRVAGRRLLAAAEVALSLVLLVGAGLLGLSFVHLQQADPGFDAHHTLAADVTLPIGDRFDPSRDGAGWSRVFTGLMEDLGKQPGVRAAGAVSTLPLIGSFESATFEIDGKPAAAPAEQSAEYAVVTGDYFPTMGVRLLSGRLLAGGDRAGGAQAIVVSRELARRYFAGQDPLGQRIRGGWDYVPTWRTIIGVVADVRQRTMVAGVAPAVYVAEAQLPVPSATVVIRGAGSPASLLSVLRASLGRVAPTVPAANVRSLEEVTAGAIAPQRFNVVIIGAFAAAALLFALIGLYGVVALSVGQRRREIGVRMALGAQQHQVIGLALGEGARLAVGGLLLGVAGALPASRVLRGLLYEVEPMNLAVLAAAVVTVAAVTLLATVVPAWRAARIAPTTTLRLE